MKFTALAVVILALGIVVGFALAGGASEGPASAAPPCPGPSAQCATPTPTPPPQQREDQISIAGGRFTVDTTAPDWIFVGKQAEDSIGLDASDYPALATFRLEVGITLPANANNPVSACVRLHDNTADEPVSGSEICVSAGVGEEIHERVRSAPLTLPAGEREYAVQGTATFSSFVIQTRLIAEWAE